MKIELNGLPILLTVVFAVLKVVGKIGWSWWWVLSPLWITAALWVVALLVFLALVFVNYILDG